jgi:hypothetical protein
MNKTTHAIVKYKDRYYIQRTVTSSCLFWTIEDITYLTIYFEWIERIEGCHGYETEEKAEEAYKEYNKREEEKYESVVHIKILEP